MATDDSDSPMKTIVKIGVVAGLGYLAYLLISNLGLAGIGQAGAPGSPATPDPQPLGLLIRARDGVTSQTELVLAGQVMTIDQVISRIRLGGRTDVDVIAAGDARQGDVDAAMNALAASGIAIWNRNPIPQAAS